MNAVSLLVVENSFVIEGRGVVVVPHLCAPQELSFKPLRHDITVRKADGTEKTHRALIAVEHFSLVGGGSKWATVICFPEAAKDDVPAGSHLMVSQDFRCQLPDPITARPAEG